MGQNQPAVNPAPTADTPPVQPSTPPLSAPASPGLGLPTGAAPGTLIQGVYGSLRDHYYQPLNQQVQLSAPPIDDPTIQALAQQILATQNASGVGTGAIAPDPKSTVAKASQHLSAGEIASKVGQETFQQMIMDPFNQFIDTWKRDPKMGLLETLGGAAVVGTTVALAANPIGAAIVLGVGAAMVLPGMINGWLNELQHPTDANLVHALVNTATGVITVGTPGKAFAGMGQLRRGFELERAAFKDLIEPRDIARKWISGLKGSVSELMNVPIGKQMDVLANLSTTMERQFKRFDVPFDEMTDPGQLLTLTRQMEGLVTAHGQATLAGDEAMMKRLGDQIAELGDGSLRHLRLQVARDYNFLPERSFGHIPMWGKIPAGLISAGDWAKVGDHLGTIMGKLDFLIQGHGFANLEVLPSVAKVGEHHAASLSDGHPEYIINETALAEHQIAALLGIKDEIPKADELTKASDWGSLADEERAWREASPYQQMEFGLENPDHWERLSPQQQVLGQVRVALENGLNIAGYKAGVIPLPGRGGVRGMLTAVTPEQGVESLSRDPTRPMTGVMHSFSKKYDLAFDENGGVTYREKRTRWQQYLDERRKDANYDPEFQAFWQQHGARVNTAIKQFGGLKGQLTFRTGLMKDLPARTKIGRAKQAATVANIQKKLDEGEATLRESLLAEGYDQAATDRIVQETFRDPKERTIAKEALPLGRKMMHGQQLVRATIAAAVYRLHAAEYGKFYGSHADTNTQMILQNVIHPKHLDDMGALLQQQEFVNKIGGKPDFLRGNLFRGGIGTEESKARAAGYEQVVPQIGVPEDLHYQPAIYAHKDIAAKIQHAYENSYSSSELHSGIIGALYKGVSTTKHVIMLSPAWHYMNVAGRAIGFILNDPALAIPAMQSISKALGGTEKTVMDTRLRARLSAEFTANGGKAANTFNVSRALHLFDREDSNQTHWPGVLRTPVGATWHAYESHIENGFWKMVDDLQLAAYQYGKYHLRTADKRTLLEKLGRKEGSQIGEMEINQLAALYANDIGGMVNPVYMNKMYKHLRNLVWFAPSYWATFTRSLLSLMPGADRMSGFLANERKIKLLGHEMNYGGGGVRLGAVPLKEISDAGRREAVRMHRSWMITYLATAVTSADILNVMLGGRHLWENDEGHQFDINVDRAASLVGQGPENKGTATKHAYFSGMPFFRQAVDVANALGLGHDYGFGHQFGDQQWQQLDAVHKAMMLGGGLLQGIESQAASKTAAPLQAAYGLLSGETLSGRAKGVQREIKGPFGRFSALSSFIPGGSAVESALTQDQPLGQAAQSWTGSLLQQYTGLPSIYHLGIEQPAIDDSKFQSWKDQRNTIHDSLKNASAQMFAGQIQPIQYERLRQQSVDKLLQLDTDTFGATTPVGALSRARKELSTANGLDRNDLTDSQWAERNDMFQMEWDQILQASSPESRAAWWETQTSQWTDADYLVWEAQQMRQALMGAIDGQGGQHIRAYQHQIGPLLDIPSTALRTQLEQGDPYYYTYRQVLKQMSQTSSLGAFINAFVSPYSNMMVEPENMTPEQEQALSDSINASATLVRPQTARALAAEAKLRAHSKAVTESGGKALADPAFAAEAEQMMTEAQANA